MSTTKSTHIVSSTPGRTRLRVSPKRRNHHQMAKIAKALESNPQIHHVRTNTQTGSIVIHHDTDKSVGDDIAGTLHDLGIILGSITDIEVPSTEGKSKVADDFTSAVADLNQQVRLATNGIVDLRLLVPVGLAMLAVHQLMRKGLQFETVPWYVLAWYAFDSFIKLHYTTEPDSKK